MKYTLFVGLMVLLFQPVFGQYKRFSIDACFSKGGVSENGKLEYKGYFARAQYNFKWLMSVNIGYGQEYQSFRNTSVWDIPTMIRWNSKIQTTEHAVPLALRATLGRKIMLYAEGGVLFLFKRKAHWEGIKNYSDPSYTDTNYDENRSLSNDSHFFYGAGLILPVYKGFCVFGEFRKQFGKYSHSFVNDDNLYQYNYGKYIVPYGGFKFSFGLSYTFNVKKESTYTFKSWYPKVNASTTKNQPVQ